MLLLPPEELQMPFRVRVPWFLNPDILELMTNPDRLRYDYQYNVWHAHLGNSRSARCWNLVHTGPSIHGRTLSWNTVYGLKSFVGAWGSECLSQSGVALFRRHGHGCT